MLLESGGPTGHLTVVVVAALWVGKLLEATEGGAGFGGNALPHLRGDQQLQGMLFGCCVGLNPCSFPKDGQESPAAHTFLLRKCSSHLPCGSPASEGLTTPAVCVCLVKTCSPSAPVLTLLMAIMRNGFKYSFSCRFPKCGAASWWSWRHLPARCHLERTSRSGLV